MTFPQQYPQYQQPGYPAQQPDPYASQQPPAPQGYAPQYGQPPAPGYPAPAPYPPQGYAAPPPGYGQPPAPEPPPVTATMQDFWDQPASAGGKSLSFNRVGQRYVGTVIRNVGKADLEYATEVTGRPGQGPVARHPDGREKLILKIPLLLHEPNPEYPSGIGVWYVKANERNELARAMEAAGATYQAPRAGDVIEIVFTHEEPQRAGMSNKKVKRCSYVLGNGQAPELPVAPAAQPAPMPAYQGYGQPAPMPGYGQPAPMPQYQAPQGYPTAAGAPIPGAQAPVPGYQQPPQAPVPGYQQPPQAPQFDPAQAQQFQQQYQQPSFPTPAAPAPAGPPSAPVQGAGAPSPSSPPPGWPADLPYTEGLSETQARTAQAMRIAMGQQTQ